MIDGVKSNGDILNGLRPFFLFPFVAFMKRILQRQSLRNGHNYVNQVQLDNSALFCYCSMRFKGEIR